MSRVLRVVRAVVELAFLAALLLPLWRFWVRP